MNDAPIMILIDDLGQGGAQRQIAIMVREFVRRGRSVMVVRYAENDFLAKELEAVGGEVVRLEGRNRVSWFRSLKRLVAQRPPAIACAFLRGPASLALFSDRLKKWPCPIVVCERASDPEGFINLRRRIELWLYERADSIICNSKYETDWLRKARPKLCDRVEHIGNAVDQDQFNFVEITSSTVRKIVVLGRAIEAKGIGVLAKAVQLMRARGGYEDVLPIKWYGQDDEQGSRLSRDIGIGNDGIVFHPPVVDVPDLLHRSDVLLLPSLAEATPNVVLEAMSTGRIVIATDVGDISQLIVNGTTGWLIPPGDAEALVAAIDSVRDMSDTEVQEMSRAARDRINALSSISAVVDAYEEVFTRLGVKL